MSSTVIKTPAEIQRLLTAYHNDRYIIWLYACKAYVIMRYTYIYIDGKVQLNDAVKLAMNTIDDHIKQHIQNYYKDLFQE